MEIHSEKLYKVLIAVSDLQNLNPSLNRLVLSPDTKNGLDSLLVEDIHQILIELENEGAFKMYRNDSSFTIECDKDLTLWANEYLVKRNKSLNSLEEKTFESIYDILLEIKLEFDIRQHPNLEVQFVNIYKAWGGSPDEVFGLDLELNAGLSYLKLTGVVVEYKEIEKLTLSTKLTINIARFLNALIEAEKIAKDREKDQSKTEVEVFPRQEIYTITYTNNREICLNEEFILSKPQLNGENDLVFSFLFQNPNKKFTLAQVETATNTRLSKSLHKIVENLRFTGDLKKMFMNVSENAIEFKNPVVRDPSMGAIKF